METPAGLTSTRAMIGQWSIDQYLFVLRWPTVIMAFALIGLILFGRTQGVILAVEALFFIGLGIMASRQRGRTVESLTLGVMGGLEAGVIASCMALILHPSAIAAINVISESLITALAGALIVTLAAILYRLLSHS